MTSRRARIVSAFHPLNWWWNDVGQTVLILEEDESSGLLKIEVVRSEETIGGTVFYTVEGWIPYNRVEEIRVSEESQR